MSAASALAQLGEAKWRDLVRGEDDDFSRLGSCGDMRALEPLLEALGEGPAYMSPTHQEEIMKALGDLRSPGAVDSLASRLRASDGRIRFAAAQALEQIGGSTVIEALTRLSNDEVATVRKYVVSLLGRLGGRECITLLIEALGDTVPSVRVAAAEALGELRDPRAIRPLFQQLSNWEGGRAAAEALAKIPDPSVFQLLTDALADPSLAHQAAYALGQLHDTAALEPLTAMLQRSDWRDESAASALGALRDPRTFPFLIEALDKGSIGSGEAAAEGLARLGDRRAIYPLIQALADTRRSLGNKSSFRQSVALALIDLGEPQWADWVKGDVDDLRNLGNSRDIRVVPALIQALRGGHELDRAGAAAALGQIGDQRALEPLIEALKCNSGLVVRWAAQALGQLGDERAVGPLIQAFENHLDDHVDYSADYEKPLVANEAGIFVPVPQVKRKDLFYTRQEVIRALGAIGDPRALEAVIEAFRHREEDEQDAANMRSCALAALERLSGRRAVEVLTKLSIQGSLYAEHGISHAKAALDELREPWTVDSLSRRLLSENGRRAAEALGAIGNPAVESLLQALKAEDSPYWASVAIHIVRALGRIGNPCAVEPLIRVANKWPTLRLAASEALDKLGEPNWKNWIKGDPGDFDRLKASGDPRAAALVPAPQRPA
jgi:HEAT repeat protein